MSGRRATKRISEITEIFDLSSNDTGTTLRTGGDTKHRTDLKINNRRQDTKYHQCNLVGEPRDIVSTFIDGGLFVFLRRRFRRSMMISQKHPYTKYYANSICRLKEEEYRHLIWNYFSIHPLSIVSFYFEMIMFFIIMTSLLAAPVIVMTFQEDRNLLFIVLGPVNASYLLLIIMNFCMGYYDMAHNRVVLRSRRIAIHYLKSYLLFDVLSILPQILRSETAAKFGLDYNMATNSVVKVVSPILVLTTYVRYFWCLRVLHKMRLFYGFSTYTFKAVRMVLNTLVIVILSVYVFHITVKMRTNLEEGVLKNSEYTLNMLMMVSYGHPAFKAMRQHICPIISILIGFIFHLLMLVEGMEIWRKFNSAENKQTTVYNSTTAYMRYRALPLELRQRIYVYLDFKYQNHFYKESVIRKTTSPALRREILLCVTKESIHRVELFHNCTGLILNKIRANLISEIFLPGDVIIKAGATGHCMFFILAGTVVVTSPEDKKLCYLRDGTHFGEVALVVNTPRVANVIAVTPCELFKLNRQHFWEVIKNYPQLWEEIKSMATDRIVETSNTIDSDLIRRTLSETRDITSADRSLDMIPIKTKDWELRKLT